MKTIVALVDFSDITFKVLKQAHTFAKAFNSEVIILHVAVNEPVIVDIGIVSPTILQTPSPESMREQLAKLMEMRDSLQKFGVRATIQQLTDESVEDVLAASKKLGADLIILGSHHHGAIYNLLIGSFTADVLKHAHCPVLVVPCGDVDEPSAKTKTVNPDTETASAIAQIETEAPTHEPT